MSQLNQLTRHVESQIRGLREIIRSLDSGELDDHISNEIQIEDLQARIEPGELKDEKKKIKEDMVQCDQLDRCNSTEKMDRDQLYQMMMSHINNDHQNQQETKSIFEKMDIDHGDQKEAFWVNALSSSDYKSKLITVINRLITHPWGASFKDPLTNEEAPGYSLTIRNPTCLSVILAQVEEGKIFNTYQLMKNISLMCHNAHFYNAKDSDLSRAALLFKDLAHEQIKDIFQSSKIIDTNQPSDELK